MLFPFLFFHKKRREVSMMKHNSPIILFLLAFLFVLPFSFASNWPQEGRSFFNDYNSQISIGNNVLNSNQNTSVGSVGSIVYDIDSDGYGEIITIESGLLRVRRYNQTTGLFSISSEFDAQGMISTPFIFSDFSGNTYLVGYSTNTFYVYTISGGSINFMTSASIPPVNYKASSGTFRASPPSPNCYTKGSSSYCVSVLNNSGFAVANITGVSMIMTNYSNALLTDWPLSYKPALFDNPLGLVDPLEYAVLFCSSGGSFGVALVNIENGSIYRSNCTTTARQPIGSPKVRSTDIYFGAVSGSGRFTEIDDLNSILLPRPGFPIVEDLGVTGFGYAGMLPASNGNIYKIYQPLSTETYIKVYNSAGSVIANVKGPIDGSTNIQQDTLSQGADFIVYGNVFYSFITNTTTRLWAGNIFSQLYESLSYQDNSGMHVLSWDNTAGVTSLHSFVVNAAPLTYPNITIEFRNNITNQTVQSVPFNITNRQNQLFISDVSVSGIEYLRDFLPVGNYTLNVPAYINGYNPIVKNFTITTGSSTIYFYLQPVMTANTTLRVYFVDTSSGSKPITPVSYSIIIQNLTGGFVGCADFSQLCNAPLSPNTDGNVTIDNVPAGNVSILATAQGYVTSASGFFNNDHLTSFCVGTCSVGVYMQPLLNASFNPPLITGYNLTTITITQRESNLEGASNGQVISVNGTGCSTPYRVVNGTIVYDVTSSNNPCFNQSVLSRTSSKVTNPPYICTNQSVYVDVFSIKRDTENYVIHIDPGYEFEPIVSNGVLQTSTLWIGPFRNSGNQSFLIYGLSASWDYNSIVYVQSPFVKLLSFKVQDCAGAIFDESGNRLVNNNSAVLSPKQPFLSPAWKLAIALIVILIITLFSGAMAGWGTSNGLATAVGAGAGLGLSLIFFTLVVQWVPLYATLLIALMCAAIIGVVVLFMFRGG